MGNRAIIKGHGRSLGIYLHWNGGRDSVEGFLEYCKLKGHRCDDSYSWARLAQVVGNFFGGTTSVGIGMFTDDDGPGDNGIYIVKDWTIVDRKSFRGREQREYKLNEMLHAIDERQPEAEQLGDLIDSEVVKTESLEVGDVVYVQDFNGKHDKLEVIGFGDDRHVNGSWVKDVPFVAKYGKTEEDARNNCNNYLKNDVYRKVTK